MTNKVKVKICGQEYTVVSGDAPAYIKKIADATDSKMAEMMTRNPALSTSMAAVLAAMNLTDELEKIKQVAREKVDAQAAEIASLKKQLENTQKAVPQKEQQNKHI